MATEFPLFIDLLRNVEMALGKVDLATARLYSTLVEDAELRERIYDMFEAEFHRTVRALLAITRQKELLESNQVLAHSIKLRNPYVDPMHLIQVDMLRRKRAGRRHARSQSRHRRHHQRHLRRPQKHRLMCRLKSRFVGVG